MRTVFSNERDYAQYILHSSRNIPNHAYFGDLPIGETWAFSGVVSLSRDSRLLETSNWQVVTHDLMTRFPGQCEIVHESHWLVGWVDSLAIHVQNDTGELMPIVYAAFDWIAKLDDYPVADEEHYSGLVYAAQIESIENTYGLHLRATHVPKSWAYRVFSWLWDNDQDACENTDDEGYVDEDSVIRACYHLGYLARREYDREKLAAILES